MQGYRTGGFFGLVLCGGESDLIAHYLDRLYSELAADTGTNATATSL
jgi:hypothetical protein